MIVRNARRCAPAFRAVAVVDFVLQVLRCGVSVAVADFVVQALHSGDFVEIVVADADANADCAAALVFLRFW